MYTWNLCNSANRCHLNKLNVKKSQIIKYRRILKKNFFYHDIVFKRKKSKEFKYSTMGNSEIIYGISVSILYSNKYQYLKRNRT